MLINNISIMSKKQLTTQEIQSLLQNNVPQWHNVDPATIKLTKLTGLTNITFKAEVPNQVEPQALIFREFGNAEGFVDQKLEKLIFSTISELNIGPKEHVCGGSWRIEEFIANAEHPTNQQLGTAEFQFKSMGVVQLFHKMKIELPNQESSTIVDGVFSQRMKEKVLDKIRMTHLFSEEELKNLHTISNLVNNFAEQQYLQEMVESENHEELVFAHNDLNQLNIFKGKQANREIVFIDYEYCSYNYPSFDIANFLNESAINYLYAESPYYALVEENYSKESQIEFVALCYELHRVCTQNELSIIAQMIANCPEVNNDANLFKEFKQKVLKLLSHRMSEDQMINLKNMAEYRARRIRRFMVLSNLNWIYWCVLQAKSTAVDFDHIDYMMMRLKMYTRMLEEVKSFD